MVSVLHKSTCDLNSGNGTRSSSTSLGPAFRRRVKGYQDVYRALGTEEDVAAVQLLLRA